MYLFIDFFHLYVFTHTSKSHNMGFSFVPAMGAARGESNCPSPKPELNMFLMFK